MNSRFVYIERKRILAWVLFDLSLYSLILNPKLNYKLKRRIGKEVMAWKSSLLMFARHCVNYWLCDGGRSYRISHQIRRAVAKASRAACWGQKMMISNQFGVDRVRAVSLSAATRAWWGLTLIERLCKWVKSRLTTWEIIENTSAFPKG